MSDMGTWNDKDRTSFIPPLYSNIDARCLALQVPCFSYTDGPTPETPAHNAKSLGSAQPGFNYHSVQTFRAKSDLWSIGQLAFDSYEHILGSYSTQRGNVEHPVPSLHRALCHMGSIDLETFRMP